MIKIKLTLVIGNLTLMLSLKIGKLNLNKMVKVVNKVFQLVKIIFKVIKNLKCVFYIFNKLNLLVELVIKCFNF